MVPQKGKSPINVQNMDDSESDEVKPPVVTKKIIPKAEDAKLAKNVAQTKPVTKGKKEESSESDE